MKILQKRKRVTCVEHYRAFEHNDGQGGFEFKCDEHGNVQAAPGTAAHDNYLDCIGGSFAVSDRGIKTYEWDYTEPAIGLCYCGEEVVLSGFTNTCVCGADYNSRGQMLADRRHWGEETGEHWCDVANSDQYYNHL